MIRIVCGVWLVLAVAMACLCGCGGGGSDVASLGDETYPDPATLSPLITARPQPGTPGRWTILVYLDADNDLESAGMANLNQMESVGSTQDVRMVVQMDRIAGHDSTSDDWTDTRRYLVTRDSDITRLNSIRLDDSPLGEVNMADPQSLRSFLAWGVQEFPADHYCLIIWDHGTGWQFRAPSELSEFKYVIADETSLDGMNVDQVRQAVAGFGIDVIAFDACLMEQLEVAYELRDAARYMVGSAGMEPSPGYNYSLLFYRVAGTTSPADLCQAIVDCYAQAYPAPRTAITQCAVDLSRMSEVASAAGAFAQLLLDQPNEVTGFEAARTSSLLYAPLATGDRYYYDLLDYATRCASVVGAEAQDARENLASAIGAATVEEYHSRDMPASCGIGVYVPPQGAFDPRYTRLQFASDTAWDEWLRSSRP